MKMSKKDSKGKFRVIRRIIRLHREEGLIPPHSRILIALSGGADSVALTLSLLELRHFLKIKDLMLVHVNHILRGEESRRDEDFCVKFAERLGLPLRVERLDVRAIAKGENLEAVARQGRYRILRKIKEEKGFDLIATAHHLNDLVETIILWLTRGCGLEGLLGFEPKEGDIVRPLYMVKREEIVAFLREEGYEWVEDSSNYDLSLARNRIRHRVIPELKSINPNLEETMLRMRNVLKAEKTVLDDLIKKHVKSTDIRDLRKLPREYQMVILNRLCGTKNYRKIEQAIREIAKGRWRGCL